MVKKVITLIYSGTAQSYGFAGKIFEKRLHRFLLINLPLEPRVYVLVEIPESITDHNVKHLLTILFSIAKKKKTITASWSKSQPPIIKQCRDKVRNVFFMENILDKLEMKSYLFDKRWTVLVKAMPEVR